MSYDLVTCGTGSKGNRNVHNLKAIGSTTKKEEGTNIEGDLEVSPSIAYSNVYQTSLVRF